MFLWSKTQQEILQLLQEKNPKLDVATFTTTDPKWYDKQKSHVIVYRALKDGGSGEMPVALAGGVFAGLITATGAKLFADWLAIPGDRKSMDWWHFKRVGEGGWWEEMETPIAEAELEGLVDEMMQLKIGLKKACVDVARSLACEGVMSLGELRALPAVKARALLEKSGMREMQIDKVARAYCSSEPLPPPHATVSQLSSSPPPSVPLFASSSSAPRSVAMVRFCFCFVV